MTLPAPQIPVPETEMEAVPMAPVAAPTAPVAVPVPPVTPAPSEPPVPQKGTKLTDTEALQGELNKARHQAAQSRERASVAEAGLAAMQQTLNPDAPPAGPAPAGEVTTEQLRKELAEANLANALWRVAPQVGADAALLVPHLRGTGQLGTLDTSDPAGLDAALLTMAQAAIASYPQLKTPGAPPPASAPGDPPAGPTLARTFTRAEVAAFTPDDYADEALQSQVNAWLRAGAPE